jgi:hypothetical protein
MKKSYAYRKFFEVHGVFPGTVQIAVLDMMIMEKTKNLYNNGMKQKQEFELFKELLTSLDLPPDQNPFPKSTDLTEEVSYYFEN